MRRGREARELRRKDSDERNEVRAELSPQKQLEELDARLGSGTGAKKERARLADLL